MFKPVSSNLNVILLEEEILRFWKVRHIFEKAGEQREGQPGYVFYEGPPTANGKPGVHHVLVRAHKDIFLRYKTMCGYSVSRRAGWDTHGLPVELEVEKHLGLIRKSQIEAYGIDPFNALCRSSALHYIQDWEKLTERIGYWVDLQNAYVTCTNEYIESVWWILKTLWEKGLIYQGYKVVPYCPRCETPLSEHEVALGYKQAEDPSIYVRMPLVEDPGTSLLVWTTTPWTLPGNVAVAAHPEVDYVIVERDLPEGGSEKLIVAQPLVGKIFPLEEIRIYETFKGKKLKGLRYQPLFTFILPEKPAYSVVLEDFVTTEDGTGLVHIAPAFGAEDLQAAMEFDLPILMTVNEQGAFVDEIRPWRGKFIKDADPLIVQDLAGRGLLYRSEACVHTYPFCWRCSTPLLYMARSTWYVRTAPSKDRLVELNRRIQWHPEHFQEGRFGNWLERNVDWALGRERYWGTPLPIWECEACHYQACYGSVAELSQAAGQDLSLMDLHRPSVDEIKILCPECSGKLPGALPGKLPGSMSRVPEVIDAWFDSGAMPVAQWHYPFENQERFNAQFPANLICEAVDQTRGWFYALHAISTLLFERECYQNVVCLGLMLDDQGQKMSTSRGNRIDPWDVINQTGADALRWHLYTASPSDQERRFSMNQVDEVIRDFSRVLWNVYAFFVTYANLVGWKPGYKVEKEPGEQVESLAGSQPNLDRWLLSELHILVQEVTKALERYDVPGGTRPIQDFVTRLSRWYLRRSRRRFWKSNSEADQQAAFETLHQVLVTLSKLLAPSMPFLAEELYQNLVIFGYSSQDAPAILPESVHLAKWPKANPQLIDETMNCNMKLIMKMASLGHGAREQARIKVRQPLSQAAFVVSSPAELEALNQYASLLADELNVKQIRVWNAASEIPEPSQWARKSEGPYLAAINTLLTHELIIEGLAREFTRKVQDYRKRAGFAISDHIRLYLQGTPRLTEAIETHRAGIAEEILAVELTCGAIPAEMATTELMIEKEKAVVAITRSA